MSSQLFVGQNKMRENMQIPLEICSKKFWLYFEYNKFESITSDAESRCSVLSALIILSQPVNMPMQKERTSRVYGEVRTFIRKQIFFLYCI